MLTISLRGVKGEGGKGLKTDSSQVPLHKEIFNIIKGPVPSFHHLNF